MTPEQPPAAAWVSPPPTPASAVLSLCSRNRWCCNTWKSTGASPGAKRRSCVGLLRLRPTACSSGLRRRARYGGLEVRRKVCVMGCRAINCTRVIENRTRCNNTAGQTALYVKTSFPSTACRLYEFIQTVRYFPLQTLSAALRKASGEEGMTRKQQPGMAREQQAEAAGLRRCFGRQAKLDAAVAKTSSLPLEEGLGVRVEAHRGSIKEPG